jgi:hypothetical protein
LKLRGLKSHYCETWGVKTAFKPIKYCIEGLVGQIFCNKCLFKLDYLFWDGSIEKNIKVNCVNNIYYGESLIDT